ncbi:hypothetical protein [Lutibacter sp.]|uniref:hypothetical protein n=1 Tax=Lutibacter sp. TaxID=1925666 RepID=UPI0025C235F7|nr:hypothetical protein [Lutibacter sp.]MCF6168276.1 hypothetical protein [Lutibacter sp.]
MKTTFKIISILVITLSLFNCSNQNGQGGVPTNPCDSNSQGAHFTETGGLQNDINLDFDNSRIIVEYVTGHPQGDYYHIYSNQGSPSLNFYTFAVTSGSTSTLDQNWNNTAGSYLVVNGSPYPQNNTITLTTVIGSNQVGGNIRIEMTGGFLDQNIPVTITGEMCVTIDAIVQSCDYQGLTFLDTSTNTQTLIPEADLTTDFFPNNGGPGVGAVEIYGGNPFVIFTTNAVTAGATETINMTVNGTTYPVTVNCVRAGTLVGEQFTYNITANNVTAEYCVVIDSVTP